MQRAGVWSVPVVVKFTDDDDTYEVSATSCRPNLTIVELRKRIADRLRIPCSVVQILQHGNDTHRLSLLSLVTFNAMRSPDRDHSVKLQCFDTVGWVILPVKTRPHMTYNVLVGR